MKQKAVFAAIAGLLLFFHSGNALALYSWIDEKGTTHISDYPKPQSPAEAASTEPGEPSTVSGNKDQVPPLSSEQAMKTDPTKTAGVITPQPSSAAAPVTAQVKSGQSLTTPILPQQRQDVSSPAVTPQVEPVPSTNETAAMTPNITFDKRTQAAAEQNRKAMAVMKKFIPIIFIFLVVGYLYFSLCLYLIARKLNVASAWIAWVPLFQIVTFLHSASKPAWWILLFFVPLVNIIIHIYLWICISENLGRDKWLGLLMLVPIVNIVYPGMLAFSKLNTGNSD
jgi:Family of unknown function (DUF5684)/Domain of unknown function (DUF4124)